MNRVLLKSTAAPAYLKTYQNNTMQESVLWFLK